MKTCSAIDVYGDPERVCGRVFQLAADIQNWPEVLPHYRYLHILEASEQHKVAAFGAQRRFAFGRFPVKWKARQEIFPAEARITYKHTGGITRGMWVEWRLTKHSDHVHVVIDHELDYPIPLLGAWFAHHIVGTLFVQSIAGETLRCIKTQVESETALPSGAS